MDSAELSRLRLEDNPQDDQTISRFEALPEEIRKEILRYLLRTKYARLKELKRKRIETTMGDAVGHMRAFDWNIAVLRVCKTMYNDGISVLQKENQWIKIMTNFDAKMLRWCCRNYDTHIIAQPRTTTLKYHIADVHFSPQNPRALISKQDQTFVLPLEDLQAFCFCLEGIDLNNHFHFSFRFQIDNKLSKSMQRQILKPFCKITGESVCQQVTFEGQISEAVVTLVKASMTLHVDWIRVKAWEIYRCVEKVKGAADEAALSGDWSAAKLKCGQAVRFLEVALKLNPTIQDDLYYDQEYKTAQWDLDTVIYTSQIVASIHSGELADDFATDLSAAKLWIGERRMKNVSPQLKALFIFVHAVAHVLIERTDVAIDLFDFAMQLCSEEQILYRKCRTIAAKYSSRPVDQKARQRAELISCLPHLPIHPPPTPPYVTELAASERYVCTKLGHHGKFPEDVMSLVKDGISIRLKGQGQSPDTSLHIMPLQGRGALRASDIDLIEVLLFDRIKGNRSLYQLGHVDTALLDKAMANPRTRVGQAVRTLKAAQKQGEGGPKVYIALSEDEIGRRSASQDEALRRNLLSTWPGYGAKYKSKIEKIVEEIVKKHKLVFK